jgi:putative sterol carrier protein
VGKSAFLSDEWFGDIRKIIDEHGGDAPANANISVNLCIQETPFGADKNMHMGATDGKPDWGEGHVDTADVTLTLDYATAKEIFVAGNPQAGMQAFMAGKIKVQGDMTKLMAMQAGGTGGNPELQKLIQDITE